MQDATPSHSDADCVAEGSQPPDYIDADSLQLGEDDHEVTTAFGPGRGGYRPFSREIVEQLKEMWTAGMVGGGKRYEEMIELACVRTGLSSSQVKVS